MEDVAAFRSHHRAEHISPRYNGWLHFATTSLGSLAAIGFSISRVRAPARGSSPASRSSS